MIVSADDIVIGNPPGFAPDDEPFARIPRLIVEIDLVASLRRGAIVIASVELEHPAIRAIETGDGQENSPLRLGLPPSDRRA